MKPAPFDYQAGNDVAQALALLAAGGDGARLCSGTQSLGPMLNLRIAQPTRLIDVSRIAALHQVTLHDDALYIGAATTHSRIEDGALPDVTCGLLPQVASSIAYRAVRNRGTLGGSLANADPAADWVSTMCLLDARLLLVSAPRTPPCGARPPRGSRKVAEPHFENEDAERSVPATQFFEGPFMTALQPGELLAAVTVPRFSTGARWAYRKFCRKPGEFAEAIAGLWLDPARGTARAVLGAVLGVPHVVEGVAALAALRQSAGVACLLDAIGVEDAYARELSAAMLCRAFADLDRFAP